MIGRGYRSTGIIVRYDAHENAWGATAPFIDAGFCDDDADAGRVSTEGEFHTRYYVSDGKTCTGLSAAIDALKADVERAGIAWTETATVSYDGDGEIGDWPPPPGWEALVNAEARRLGWMQPYAEQAG